MNLGRVIYLTCLERHVLLERKGDDELGVRRFGGPLAPDLRALLVEHKAEVIEFLTWRTEARAAVAATLARIERLYVADCDFDTDEIRQAERELHDAFWAAEQAGFTRALRRWRMACLCAISRHRDWATP